MQRMSKGDLGKIAKPQRPLGHRADSCLFLVGKHVLVLMWLVEDSSYRKVNVHHVEACSPPQ